MSRDQISDHSGLNFLALYIRLLALYLTKQNSENIQLKYNSNTTQIELKYGNRGMLQYAIYRKLLLANTFITIVMKLARVLRSGGVPGPREIVVFGGQEVMTQSENRRGSKAPSGVTITERVQVPFAAKWLGAFGAIPFITLAVAVLFLEGAGQEKAYFAIAAYGAVILSFLGGIHWGLAVADGDQAEGDGKNLVRLGGSVVPSLVGWVALFLTTSTGLFVLAAAFAGMLLFDWHASRKAHAPRWYPKLRCPLTTVVVVSLVVTAVV
jgi:hypothetical protein